MPTPLIAGLASSIALLGLGVVGCGGSDGGNGSATGSSSSGTVDGGNVRVDAAEDGGVEPADDEGADSEGDDAPPFNFAGSDSSGKVDDEFAWPAEAGEGRITFADGREAPISLTSCSQFTPDRVSTGRGKFGLDVTGRGEMDDGQRFRIQVDHRDGVNTVTLITTRDPAAVAEHTSPVWSTLEVSAQANGLNLEVRDFWLLATVTLERADGPRPVSTPANLIGSATGLLDRGTGESEARELLEDLAQREASKGFAAKVESLALTCTDA